MRYSCESYFELFKQNKILGFVGFLCRTSGQAHVGVCPTNTYMSPEYKI